MTEERERSERCVVIPAIAKNAVIPDQLLKKLAGVILIQRALDTALAVEPGANVVVVTDSEEIRLIAARNGVECRFDPGFEVRSVNIVSSLEPVLQDLARHYRNIIIYRASSPLITAADMEDAYARFLAAGRHCLVTVKSVKYRLWEDRGADLAALLYNEEEREAYVETRGLFMVRSDVFDRERPLTGAELQTVPYFLHDRAVEITGYQDWWICEKLLQRRHIVFVVAGYPAIGMGHIFRALMLAHEIADHRVTFLCTRESELAAASISARDYRTRVQGDGDLAREVLRLKPDLVINDILNTDARYIGALKAAGVRVVNFEDEGEGAPLADLVINALYESEKYDGPRFLYGHENFCLRDEFLHARGNVFRPQVKRVMITFGGTDAEDYTRATLLALYPDCRVMGITLTVVVGPGYAHKESLAALVESLNAGDEELCGQGALRKSHGAAPFITFSHATNVMSRMMEGVDAAVCSAGRTVYEMAHMRIPAMVISRHSREDMHTFARPENGFLYLGIMGRYDASAVRRAFGRLLDPVFRKEQYDRLCRFDFTANKTRVVGRILELLASQEKRS